MGGITTPDECDSEVSWTVRSSDESDASIFGLRHMLHEVEEGSEISAASSDDDNEIAVAERKAVAEWRIAAGMECVMDFAYCFVNFEEAYKSAGQPVAVAWSTARLLACPELAADMAKVSKIDATTTKIAKVNEQRKNVVSKKRRVTSAASLRQPGKGTEVEEEDSDKQRFVEPLARLMMDCKVGRAENISVSNDGIMNSLRRKAGRLVTTSETPTLHRAITTAAELRKYPEEKPTYMDVDKIEPITLEEFLWQSRSQGRVINAISWVCKNLDLGWPWGKVVKPNTKKSFWSVWNASRPRQPSRACSKHWQKR